MLITINHNIFVRVMKSDLKFLIFSRSFIYIIYFHCNEQNYSIFPTLFNDLNKIFLILTLRLFIKQPDQY